MHKLILLIFPLITVIYSCSYESAESPKIETNSYGRESKPEIVNIPQDSLKEKENPYKKAKIEVKAFKADKGWGYDIILDGNHYIHQINVPSKTGNIGFEKEEYAKKIGEFVANKIRKNILPPSVNQRELDSLGVR